MLWPRAPVLWALCASALLHLAVVISLAEVEPPRAVARRAPRPAEFVMEFEPTSAGESTGHDARRLAEEPPIMPGGPPLTGALDQRAPEGRGGELRALERGALLFPFRSPVTLQDTELNNLAVNQVQRIRTATERATQEERRATPSPADAVLLASGRVGHAERRDPAHVDPVAGAPRKTTPSSASDARTVLGATRDAELGDEVRAALVKRAGVLTPAQGIARGRGRSAQRAAKVTFARPNVDRGAAATPAEQIDERVRDDADAELLAAKLQRSFVDSSVQRAAQVGAGSGGLTDDPRALGETGSGRGARARPYMPGSGTFGALDTSDARYLRWFTQQRSRVQSGLEFPRARAIAKDQGTSLYSVVLLRDGALSGRPRLVRSSGFADFDRAAADAIERALPFAPLPAELAPELPSIALLIPVAFSNPMIE